MRDDRYRTRRWRKRAADHLLVHPHCIMCIRDGRVVPAKVCDHINPARAIARDDPDVFYTAAIQSLCRWHHDSVKRRAEHAGPNRGADAAGIPRDPNHPWNKADAGH